MIHPRAAITEESRPRPLDAVIITLDDDSDVSALAEATRSLFIAEGAIVVVDLSRTRDIGRSTIASLIDLHVECLFRGMHLILLHKGRALREVLRANSADHILDARETLTDVAGTTRAGALRVRRLKLQGARFG